MTRVRTDYLSGLDFGTAGQFTALAVLERTRADRGPDGVRPAAEYALRLLERFPLGTSYAAICQFTAVLFDQKFLRRTHLVVDHTGVGQPVIAQLRQAGMHAKVIPIAVGGGATATSDGGAGWRLPRAELISNLQVLLQDRRLHIAPSLEETPTLVRALSVFEAKPSKAETDSLESWRQRPQDDLVLAVAVARWFGEHRLRHLCIFA
jgi:hypothetical protein